MSNETLPAFADNPFFGLCRADPNVVQQFGANPTRIYHTGEAPQGVASPFANYQLVGGGPENHLAGRPDIDRLTLQVDVYADTAALCQTGAQNIIAAIEGDCYVSSTSEGREPQTRKYRITFTADFLVNRKTR